MTPPRHGNTTYSIIQHSRESSHKLENERNNTVLNLKLQKNKLFKEELERTTAAKHRIGQSMTTSPVKKINNNKIFALQAIRSPSRSRSRSGERNLDTKNQIRKSELERKIRCDRLGLICDIPPFIHEAIFVEESTRKHKTDENLLMDRLAVERKVNEQIIKRQLKIQMEKAELKRQMQFKALTKIQADREALRFAERQRGREVAKQLQIQHILRAEEELRIANELDTRRKQEIEFHLGRQRELKEREEHIRRVEERRRLKLEAEKIQVFQVHQEALKRERVQRQYECDIQRQKQLEERCRREELQRQRLLELEVQRKMKIERQRIQIERQKQAQLEDERQAIFARREVFHQAQYERERCYQKEIELQNAVQAEREAELFRTQQLELLAKRRKLQVQRERQRYETQLRLERDNDLINIRLVQATAQNSLRQQVAAANFYERKPDRSYNYNRVDEQLKRNAAQDYGINMALQEDQGRRALIYNDLRRSRDIRFAALKESPRQRSDSRSPFKKEDVDNTIIKSRLESDIEMIRVQNQRRAPIATH